MMTPELLNTAEKQAHNSEHTFDDNYKHPKQSEQSSHQAQYLLTSNSTVGKAIFDGKIKEAIQATIILGLLKVHEAPKSCHKKTKFVFVEYNE